MQRVSRIFILAFIFIQVFLTGYAQINPHNGVAYLLLPKEINGLHGVYRLNEYSDPYNPIIPGNGKRIFDLNFGGAKVVNGLAVNQSGKLYLFIGPNATGVYTPVDATGWIPVGKFDNDSAAYVKAIGQDYDGSVLNEAHIQERYNNNKDYIIGWFFDGGGFSDSLETDTTKKNTRKRWFPKKTTNYENMFWVNGWNHNVFSKGSFTDESGNSYDYKYVPFGPATHKNIPAWDGSTGIIHPLDPMKVILPNKWGAISYYAFGSPKAPADHVGKLMDGKDGKPLYTTADYSLHWTDPAARLFSPYVNGSKYFVAMVKRVYEKRDRSLDLYSYEDDVIPPATAPYSLYPTVEATNVLTATDLKITEMYGKCCGDNCIPGGDLNPEAIGKIEACVQVFTSTTGRRYGFNPNGKKVGPYSGNDAALRVVHSGVTYNLNFNSTNIRNFAYFDEYLDVPLENATILGVSSNFDTPTPPITTAPDHLYASIADKFCIQDSWWGNGGIAYEYYAQDKVTSGMTFLAGHIYRLNYLETNKPIPEDVGFFTGDIDAIGVDGHGNLYILYTELDCPNLPAWPDVTGLPQGPDLPKIDPHAGVHNPIVDHSDFLEISSWYRIGDSGDYEVSGPGEDGDYVIVRLKQKINKVCRKYTPNAGGGFSLGSVEERGKVYSGFDAIRHDLVFDGTGFDWNGLWRHDFGIGSRTAIIDSEFAVVNIAERPSNIENGNTFSICRYDRTPSNTPIEEDDQEIVFKVEGYRPYGADGNIQHLVNVGVIPGLGNVYVNMIPPYENIDEDGDGIKGSFPSGMFENNAAYKLDVKWHVDLIVPGAGTNYSADQIIKSWHDLAPEPGLEKLFKFKFPQPGTYAVYATFDFNYFEYENLPEGARPDQLINHIGTKSISEANVQKVLYHVQSPSNTLSDGFITNITLETSDIFETGVNAAGESGYAMKEDRAPASLSFSFEAQFVRDANNADTAAKFETFNGIGVWDYGFGPHVYNRNTDGTVNMSEYNPGKKRSINETATGKFHYECGTRVDEAPNQDDLDAITYRLLIYPPYENTSGTMVDDTPLELGSGTCRFANVTPVGLPGSQKYRIDVDIPAANLKTIRTPLDPEKYRVRLELEYPRVKWHEHSHAAASGIITEAQYRSIIPDSPLRGLISNEPSTVASGDVGKDTTPGLFSGLDYWEICARDLTITSPDFTNISLDATNPVTQIATHTTGDPIPPCEIKITFEDNNPNSRFEALKMRYELPVGKRDLVTKTDNNLCDGVQNSDYAPLPDSPHYFDTDDYKIAASYTFTVEEYGGSAGTSAVFGPGETFQHWVGSLSFSLEGDLFDGLGATQTNSLTVPHKFSKTATDPRLKMTAIGLERYDNDPPSIKVNIVSQADNRRWEFNLTEANTDLQANPGSVAQLASPTLEVKCFKINDASAPLNEGSLEVTGSSNSPIMLNTYQTVDLTSVSKAEVIAALPVVRRSSRLMISVGLADNVDYLDFSDANITVSENTGAGTNTLLPATTLKTNAQPDDDFDASLKYDRGRYYIDVPMKVLAGQTMPGNAQITVQIYAADKIGNERTLIIPIQVVDSTFDARVLESSENRE